MTSLTNPNIISGMHFLIALVCNDPTEVAGVEACFSRFEDGNGVVAAADVHPAIITKLAAPKSIQPYPTVSVLQNLRGNNGKSTASMAMVVNMYTEER